jgi:hypothetical protein
MNPSLLLIPDRYKAAKLYSQIPDSGAGDLTFARNSNATRVNSAGLIEKVRTNLFQYSNTFSDAYWTKPQSSVVSGQVDPNGGVTAFKLVEDTSTDLHWLLKSGPLSGAGEWGLSIFAKPAGRNFIAIGNASLGEYAYFNLSNGTIVSSHPNAIGKIEAAGNGFYRCSVTLLTSGASATGFFISTDGSTTSYTGDGTSGLIIFGAQLETGVLTPYIPTTTAAVSVGITADVPRLDYTGGGCPSLLLEPQRANLTQFSEQLNNAYWNKTGSTATANVIASPDGFQNADLLTESATTADHAFFDIVSYFVSGTTYTLSFFAKANGRTKVEVASANSGTCPTGRFDLVAKTATATNTSFGAKIEDYGNGWFRCSVSRVAPNTGLDLPYHAMVQSFGTLSYAGDGTSGMYFWGMQTEAGSYPTSYIPTLGSSVTRLADAASKTGISSLIGQTEGVIFVEFQKNVGLDAANMVFSLSDGTSANLIYYNLDGGVVEFLAGGATIASKSGIVLQNGINKIAVFYKLNDFGIFLNGSSIFTDTSGAVPIMTKFNLGNWFNDSFTVGTAINTAALYPVRLSNSELATLTSL